jgi:hypothetical protein
MTRTVGALEPFTEKMLGRETKVERQMHVR